MRKPSFIRQLQGLIEQCNTESGGGIRPNHLTIFDLHLIADTQYCYTCHVPYATDQYLTVFVLRQSQNLSTSKVH